MVTIDSLKHYFYVLGEQMQSSRSGHDDAYSQGKRRGHPPGLRGKEIGLYYRNKSREKAARRNMPILKLPSYVEQSIKTVLHSTKTFYNSIPNERSDNECGNKYRHISDSQFKRKFLEIINGDIQCNLAKAMSMESRLQRNNDIDKMLLNEYNEKQEQADYKSMLIFRSKLPAYRKRSEILQLVRNNQVVVISGETGEL